ncbi:hypothetical protein M3Y98_00364800 [Aphelenchoides besseyi]|nr:hypothetical protein M3Y98_00364800 [Aphelenchoides besseyi]KAI6201752.1 hypothetical protein M3Y96_00875700 [Aphelenchoides besseyi]
MATRIRLLSAFGKSTSSLRSLRCSSSQTAKTTSNDVLGRELYLNNQVVRLIFNSPKNRNALSLDFMSLLHKELTEIDKIEKLRAVILAAEGPAFSAGHNLKELTSESGKQKHKEVFAKCTQLLSFIRQMQLPVIAEVEGVSAAAGTQLVSTCDVVVASESATFSVPGLKAGLFCSTPGIPLSRSIPHKLAMDMLLTARSINAQEALSAGLVSRVVSKGEARIEALRVAEEITKMSRSVTALGKAFYYTQSELRLSEAYRLGESVMTENLKYKDCQEGIDSFIKKRQPEWTHGDERVL